MGQDEEKENKISPLGNNEVNEQPILQLSDETPTLNDETSDSELETGMAALAMFFGLGNMLEIILIRVKNE
jgi:hypothetical protein